MPIVCCWLPCGSKVYQFAPRRSSCNCSGNYRVDLGDKGKAVFFKSCKAAKCLLLYDGDISDKDRVTGRAFASKLEQYYGHLFDIKENCPVEDADDVLFGEVQKYPVVFLYELPLEKRSKVTRYCVDTGKRIYITPTVEDIVARGYDVKHFIDTPLFAYNGSFKTNLFWQASA